MMNNLKHTLILVLLLVITAAYGQKGNGDRIKSLKIAYITEQLALTSKEAQAFWPAYNLHEEKMSDFRKKERLEIRSKLRDFDAISDKEANALVEKYIALEDEKHKEQQLYIQKMKKIIPAKKAVLLMKAEEDFKRQLIKQYRGKKVSGS